MNADEKDICKFLGQFKDVFVSVVEVSRRVGNRKDFNNDRTWAKPTLLRMEVEGLIESNEYGEFRIRDRRGDTTFKDAMRQAVPCIPLGETTIIRIEDILDESMEIKTETTPWSGQSSA